MTNDNCTPYSTHAPGPTEKPWPKGLHGSKRLILQLRSHRRRMAPAHPVYRLTLPAGHEPPPSAPHQSSSTAHTGSVVGERMSAARWALVSGGAGLVSGLFLVMFYAVGEPLAPVPSRWNWLGPANDLSSAVQAAALIPVALEGSRLLPSPYVRRWTRIGVSAMVAGSILPVLLLARLIPFAVQTPLAIAAFAATYGWVFTINRAAARRKLVRLTVAHVGMVSALALGAALAAAGVAALLPAQSTALRVTGGIAVVAGVIAWLGFPLWTLLVWARPCTPAVDATNA
jgi:hypothetical protein